MVKKAIYAMVEGDCDEVSLPKSLRPFVLGYILLGIYISIPSKSYCNFIADYYYVNITCAENYIPFKNT